MFTFYISGIRQIQPTQILQGSYSARFSIDEVINTLLHNSIDNITGLEAGVVCIGIE